MTTDEPTSSQITSLPTSCIVGAAEHWFGGGSAVVAAMNPSSTPWQASIAVKDAIRVPAAAAAALSADRCSPVGASAAG